jgi:CRP-like cAMP-binding protein
MKTFDWKTCFKDHPVFWDLGEDEVEVILGEDLSREIICQPQQVIIREGEVGDSVFLVGRGEVSVVLTGDRGPGTHIAVLGTGEFFGEMAVLEGRPRMATVLAASQCTLLEINGEKFREFLVKHPAIEFKIAAKLSHRLRDVTEHVLTARFKDVDQKLELFNNKLESELRVMDASMKATQAVFDQTNKRANEIIESAERSRNRLTASVSAVAGAIGILVTVLGYLGIQRLNKVDAALEKFDSFEAKSLEIAEFDEQLHEVQLQISDTQDSVRRSIEGFHLTVSIPQFPVMLSKGDRSANLHYRELMEQQSSKITLSLFKVVFGGLLTSADRDIYIDLLTKSLDERYLTPEQKVISYYLMLSGMVVADRDYEDYMAQYFDAANEYRKSRGTVRELLGRELRPDFFAERVSATASNSGDGAGLPADANAKLEQLQKIWDVVP